MTDTPTTRPAPPPVEPRCPDCPICYDETNAVDGSFQCDDCGCYWPRGFGEPGEWFEDDATQCPSTHQPYRDNRYIADPVTREKTFRCVLDDGHEGRHRHPDAIPEWTDKPRAGEPHHDHDEEER